MPVSLDEYKRLKGKVDGLRDKAIRAAGAHEEAMKRLRELGFDSIEAARARIERLKKDKEAAEDEYQEKLKQFKERWGDRLQ